MGKFNQEDFNKFILDNNLIDFLNHPIKLKSGRTSHLYVNWRINDVCLLDRVSDYIIAFTQDLGLNSDCFYGIPEGATRLGIITQYKWAKQSQNYKIGSHPFPMGRAAPKYHGMPKNKYFVGIPKGKVIVIEDVVSTSSSLLKTLDNLIEEKIPVISVLVLTDRMELRNNAKSVKQIVETKGISYYALSNALQLLPKISKKLKPNKNIAEAIEKEFEEFGIEKVKLTT